MKKYSRIFSYLSQYKSRLSLYLLCIVLSIVFSIVSLGMLMPFLELIFNGDTASGTPSLLSGSSNPAISFIRKLLLTSIESGGGFSTEGKLKTLLYICILLIIFILLKNVFIYLASYALTPVKNRIVNNMRTELYNKVLQLPIGYFTERRKGDLISRITNDINEVEGSLVGTLEGWVSDPLSIIFNFAILFYLSPQLTLFLLFFLPVIGFIIGRISRSLKRPSSEAAIKYGESLSILDETLSGLRVIKAFNIESVLRSRFFQTNLDLNNAKNRIAFRRDMASPTSEFLGVAVFSAILWYGGSGILSGSIPLEGSAFIGYLALFYNVINPAKSLSTSFSNMKKGEAAIGRIEEVLKAPVTVEDKIDGQILTDFNSAIEFRNVTFAYEDVVILKDINLTIEKGKTVALVGSSGAGKSTLADLVPRFHDVTDGEILIDGVNIKEYTLRSLRSQISIVTQEPILFNDTIANNIALGMESAATPQAIEGAAEVANAHQFIIKKDAGFDTNIGDRGSKLSGGERQRLTIARAVLKNPPILILDEATSSLDTESERLVQDAINNMMQNRTSIVIAHRLSTIRHADEIIVLQHGCIVQRGTHFSLLKEEGLYKKLIEMQEVK